MTVKYTKDHEWIKVEGDTATVGITEHAQEQLGDVVFVELPAVGKKVAKGGEAAVVESVKAASEVYAPVSGEVIGVNKELEGDPALVNREAEGGAWFMKVKLADKAELNDFMDKVIPKQIRAKRPFDLPKAMAERSALSYLRQMAARNEVFTSMIGMGYYGTITPKVILRNVLENPGWYTAYTPYQAEVSQG